MVSSLLDIKDARGNALELWTSPYADCLMNILGVYKPNGHRVDVMEDYYYLSDRRKENFRKKHGFRPMDKRFLRMYKEARQ